MPHTIVENPPSSQSSSSRPRWDVRVLHAAMHVISTSTKDYCTPYFALRSPLDTNQDLTFNWSTHIRYKIRKSRHTYTGITHLENTHSKPAISGINSLVSDAREPRRWSLLEFIYADLRWGAAWLPCPDWHTCVVYLHHIYSYSCSCRSTTVKCSVISSLRGTAVTKPSCNHNATGPRL